MKYSWKTASSWSTLWLIAWMGVAVLLGSGNWRSNPHTSVSTSTTQQLAEPVSLEPRSLEAEEKARYQTIETIRVGQRIPADDPLVEALPGTSVDPSTWRHLRLRADLVWPDGTVDDLHVETLQPPEWIALHKTEIGSTVPIPLDLVEMGLPADLCASVTQNSPCVAIENGPGRVVLTTVNLLNRDVYELTIIDSEGVTHTIRPTGQHKFLDIERREWVSAEELLPGQQIFSRVGVVTVKSIDTVPGTYRVYNMTVEGDHVYYVSHGDLLAHNNGCAAREPIRVNLGGEGEVPGADLINVQPFAIGGSTQTALENSARVKTKVNAQPGSQGQVVIRAPGNNLPFPSNSIDEIHINNSPLDRGETFFGPSFTTSEIDRVLSPNGKVFIDGELR